MITMTQETIVGNFRRVLTVSAPTIDDAEEAMKRLIYAEGAIVKKGRMEILPTALSAAMENQHGN